MATINPTVTIIGKVVENKVISGTDYKFNRLTVLAGNGKHWDSVVLHKDAPKDAEKVISNVKPGQLVILSDCFLDSYISAKGESYVQIRARNIKTA